MTNGSIRHAFHGHNSCLPPRISAAGFDIDTGKYHGPSPWDAVGFNPDTGAPIWPGQGKASPSSAATPWTRDAGTGGLSLPGGLKDAPPAAKVLWAVQTGQVPHLKGIPAIDEYGGIHPEYARAVGLDASGGVNDETTREIILAEGKRPSAKKEITNLPWGVSTEDVLEGGEINRQTVWV